MMRVLGLFGFTGGFLAISPSLRQTVVEGANTMALFVEQHSPYSYAGLALLVFGGVTLTLRSGQRAR